MGDYLYNGVRLPDINEIWTEEMKKTCHACVIYRRNSDGVYRLLFGGSFLEYYLFTYDGSDRYFRISGGFHRYDLINGKWTFSDFSASESDKVAPRVADNTMVWTNRDLLVKPGGAVYLAASEPVPVGAAPEEPPVSVPDIDPFSLTMGWLGGSWVLGRKGKGGAS